jgi:8-oxo-dGTP pyrophosphatase MutT (NUDIX family)
MESQSMGEKLGRRIQKRRLESGPLEGVGAFIYCTCTKRYLFLLRNESRYSGTWGVVGGKIESGELILESLLREMTEEIGGTIPNAKLIPLEKFTSDNDKFIYHTFIVPVEEEFVPVLNNEHRGYCWVSLEDHPKPLHPGVWRTINFEAVVAKIRTLEAVL